MNKFRLGVSALFMVMTALLLTACPEKKAEVSTPAPEVSEPVERTVSNIAAAVSEPMTETATSAPVNSFAAASSSELPVECGNYVKQVVACADKLGNTGDMFKKNLEDTKAQWLNISDREVLANTCRRMLDQFEVSSKAAGC